MNLNPGAVFFLSILAITLGFTALAYSVFYTIRNLNAEGVFVGEVKKAIPEVDNFVKLKEQMKESINLDLVMVEKFVNLVNPIISEIPHWGNKDVMTGRQKSVEGRYFYTVKPLRQITN
jgi:hypothetical protein